MSTGAPQYLRAPVIGHTLWVTRHHDDENVALRRLSHAE